MTREEAIQWLKLINTKEFGWDEFALQESQREIRERCEQGVREAIYMAIEALSADVVRCKDCIQKHIGGSVTQYYWCDLWDREVDGTDFCAWGERREP